MNATKQMLVGGTAVGAALLYYLVLRPKQPEPTLVGVVAEPDYMLHPLRAWMGSGHMGPFHHTYDTEVMTNTHPEAIQLAEGTVSVTAMSEAPGYVKIPSQLGGI